MWEAGNREAGVTLLEALVVIAIVAMVSAIVVPEMGRSLSLLSLRQSVSIVQADLRVAHATAMRTDARVDVARRPDGHGYDWIGGTRQLPANIKLTMSGPISFFGDGSIIPGPVSVSNEGRQIPVFIDSTTGAVTAGGR